MRELRRKEIKKIGDSLEYTLMIIKSDALNYKNEIIQRLSRCGFIILAKKKFRLFPEQAAEFYKALEKSKKFMLLVYNLSKGPIEAIIVTKSNCVKELYCLVGDESPSDTDPSNAQFNFYKNKADCHAQLTHGIDCSNFQNPLHASNSKNGALREIHFFFPNFIIEPIKIKDAEQIGCNPNIMKIMLDGLQKNSPATPDPLFELGNFWLNNNPEKPIADGDKFEETPSQDEPVNTQATANVISHQISKVKPKKDMKIKLRTRNVIDENEGSRTLSTQIDDGEGGTVLSTSTSISKAPGQTLSGVSSSSSPTTDSKVSSSQSDVYSSGSTCVSKSIEEELKKLNKCSSCNVKVNPNGSTCCPQCNKITEFSIPEEIACYGLKPKSKSSSNKSS